MHPWLPSSFIVRIAFTLPLLLAVAAAAAGQTRAYGFLPLVDQNQVVPMDAATHALLPGIATGAQPVGVAVSSDGRRAYTANLSGDSVTVIDVATLTAITTVPVGDGPTTLAISPDNRKAYVVATLDQAITVLDLTTNTVTGTIPMPGFAPRSVAFRPDGVMAYVAGNGVTRILAATDAFAGVVSLATAARDIAIPSDALAFVALESTNQVQPIDLATQTPGVAVNVGAGPAELAVSPDRSSLYVTNAGSNNVSVIDVASRTVVATIPVGSQPQGVAFRPDGQRAFVANTASSTVSVIDTATRAVIASPAVPGQPAGLGGPFVTPPLIVPTGGPFVATTDAALETAGFGRYVPFLGGVFQMTGNGSLHTSRELSLLSPGGTLDAGILNFFESFGGSSGPGALTLTGGGHFLLLGGVYAHTGGTTLSRGFMDVGGTHRSPITITSVSAQLRGTGTVGVVNVNAGSIAPGGQTIAPLRATQVTFAAESSLGVFIDGNDRAWLDVSGTTALNGARLSLTELNAPAIGVPLVVATNVTGTFEDLPEGSIKEVPSSGPTLIYRRYRISYVGGDGNDATVTKLNDPPFFQTTIPAQSTPDGVPLVVPVVVGDLNQTPAELTVTATSSNQTIVRNANLTLTAPPVLQLTIAPEVGATGDVTITLTVSDGIDTATTSFVLSVLERTYYLAEGATGPFFDTAIAVANPNPQVARFQATFLTADGTTVTHTEGLGPYNRATIGVDFLTGLDAAAFSTVVSSTFGQPLVVERTMRWDAAAYGAHTEKAAAGLGRTWYFAEGSQGYFSTYFLLVNPQPTPNVAHVTYFRENAPPLQRTYQLAARSRTTIDAGGDAELRDRSFGALVTFDLAAAAERAMYFGTNPLWQGGHASFGTPAASTSWFLAEGATGSYFATYVLLANPNDQPVEVTLTYYPASGSPISRIATIPAGQRLTKNIGLEDPSLANAAVATQVTASLPIIVERSQYWGSPAWIEAHNSAGVPAPATRWGLAEGIVGTARGVQTYILLANTGTQPATVTISFLRFEGAPLVKTFTVAPQSRFNVSVNGPDSHVPELMDAAFGALIESTQPIVVERSMYWNAGGLFWAAGTNATATRLP